MKFYKLEDQVIISDKPLSISTELVANTVDTVQEKHVPVISITDNTVAVSAGSIEHPSLPVHHIEFIVLLTETGFRMRWLKPGIKPETTFILTSGEKPVAAYEYCNLHGLWIAEA